MHHPSHRGIANFINPNSRWFVIGFTSVAAFIYAGSLGYFMGINISQQYMMGPSENGWHLPIATNWNWEYPIRRQTHFLRVYLGPEFVFFFKMFAGVVFPGQVAQRVASFVCCGNTLGYV
jgi:hypothetical protein